MCSLLANSCDLLSASLGLTCTKSHQIFTTTRETDTRIPTWEIRKKRFNGGQGSWLLYLHDNPG